MTGLPSDLAELERQAAEQLDPAAWEYLARGFADNVTRAANVDAWARLRLRPHVLRDMADAHTRTTVLGIEVPSPILVAPTAMHRFFDDDGELATARGAASVDALYIVSMAATTSLEDVAAAAPARAGRRCTCCDRGRTRMLAGQARGRLPRSSRPSTRGGAAPGDPPNSRSHRRTGSDSRTSPRLTIPIRRFDGTGQRLRHHRDVRRPGSVRRMGALPVVVKGVARDDAERCVDAGAAAIAVSNHGGRVMDGIVATADVLGEIVDAVDGRAEIYVDGGIRHGADVVKASRWVRKRC
jgi:4-hydroxymandelate oxidase